MLLDYVISPFIVSCLKAICFVMLYCIICVFLLVLGLSYKSLSILLSTVSTCCTTRAGQQKSTNFYNIKTGAYRVQNYDERGLNPTKIPFL
jgi:hypothetical protein